MCGHKVHGGQIQGAKTTVVYIYKVIVRKEQG